MRPVVLSSCPLVRLHDQPVFTYLAYALAGIVTGMRTWAIWSKSRLIGALLLLAWLGLAAMEVGNGLVMFFGTTAVPNDPEGGCDLDLDGNASEGATRLYIAVASYEAFIFLGTLLPIFRWVRSKNVANLTFVLYRDAILASTCMLVTTLGAMLFSLSLNSNFYIFWVMGRAFGAIFPTRIILNLREACLNLDGSGMVTTAMRTGQEDAESVSSGGQSLSAASQGTDASMRISTAESQSHHSHNPAEPPY